MTQSVYLRGNPIPVICRFFDVDPFTGDGVADDPDVVTFTVLNPDNESVDYVYLISPLVTNPTTGVYLLSLPPESPVGAYRWRCAGTGTGLVAAEEGSFDVIESGVLPPDSPLVAVDGPCSSWITGEDVASNGPPIDGIGSDFWKLDDVAYDASSLLYALSGRQYPGACEWTVRPCTPPCGGWGAATWGTPFYWTYSYFGWGLGWGWSDGSGGAQACGCQPESAVFLSGYPVREIVEVKIGGEVLPEYDTVSGYRNWRLDNRRYLTRMSIPGDPVNVQAWPACQNLTLDDDQPGTFSVKYTWGADTPSLGRAAAVQLARELWTAMGGGKCLLPEKVTKVVRQGVTIERVTPIAALMRQGATGLTLVDAFIAKSNPIGMLRRPAVYSPDMQQFARKVGQR